MFSAQARCLLLSTGAFDRHAKTIRFCPTQVQYILVLLIRIRRIRIIYLDPDPYQTLGWIQQKPLKTENEFFINLI